MRQGVVDLERFAFRDFISDRPLERLCRIQEAVQSRIVLRPRRRIPRFTGGVDVAYPRPDVGVAAYALVETATGRLVWSAAVRRPVAFPYISTYLSFREIPILLELLDEVRAAGRLADVLLVDGSGILHHRHAGIASHLGVAASLPTIGVTKKLLCGQVDIKGMAPGESRPVWQRDQETNAISAKHPSGRSGKASLAPFPPDETRLLGVALRPTAGSQRPIFISPGHRVDVTFAEQLVRELLCGHRLPEPIYWADRLSRKGEALRCGPRTVEAVSRAVFLKEFAEWRDGSFRRCEKTAKSLRSSRHSSSSVIRARTACRSSSGECARRGQKNFGGCLRNGH